MNIRTVMLIAFVVLVGALFIRKINLGFRFALCVVFAAMCSLFAVVVSSAPHRLAESQFSKAGQLPTEEWLKGALATRDEVHHLTILWALPLAVLLVLCFYLYGQINAMGSRHHPPSAKP